MVGVAVSSGGAAVAPAHASAEAADVAHSNASADAVVNRAAAVTFRLEGDRALGIPQFSHPEAEAKLKFCLSLASGWLR
jgi:hypothetical protein